MAGGLRFGLFPLGLAGAPGGLASGPPDDFDKVSDAVRRLQGDGPPLLIRMYVSWTGVDSTRDALAQVGQLAGAEGVSWDLVLAYRDPTGDVSAWTDFVTGVVDRFGNRFDAIQVTCEANFTSVPMAADRRTSGQSR